LAGIQGIRRAELGRRSGKGNRAIRGLPGRTHRYWRLSVHGPHVLFPLHGGKQESKVDASNVRDEGRKVSSRSAGITQGLLCYDMKRRHPKTFLFEANKVSNSIPAKSND
jgi:hypothetical protein